MFDKLLWKNYDTMFPVLSSSHKYDGRRTGYDGRSFKQTGIVEIANPPTLNYYRFSRVTKLYIDI